MGLRRQRMLKAVLFAGVVFLVVDTALAGEAPEEPNEAAAKRLAELQSRLLAADLVVRGQVTNTVAAGEKSIVVLSVRETLRGAVRHKTIYVETGQEDAAALDEHEALWLLKATDTPRRFVLDSLESVLEAGQADEIKEALKSIEYAKLQDLKFTVSLDKKTYKLDEPIRLTWTIENPTDKPIVIAVPHVWGAGLGLLLERAGDGAKFETMLEQRASLSAEEREAAFTFHTLFANGPSVARAVSVFRLLNRDKLSGPPETGSLLEPGKYVLKLTSDTSDLAAILGGAVPKEVALGKLETARIAFEVSTEKLSTLDEAKGVVARMAGVDDIENALEQDDPEAQARAIEAIRDYSSPGLLPLLERMLRVDDPQLQAAACDAVTMWARHPAVIEARLFAKLLEDPAAIKNVSLIARAAAEVAEAQNDATMIPALLALMKDKRVGSVVHGVIALAIGEIAGLEIDPYDLDGALETIEDWVEKHPEQVGAPDRE